MARNSNKNPRKSQGFDLAQYTKVWGSELDDALLSIDPKVLYEVVNLYQSFSEQSKKPKQSIFRQFSKNSSQRIDVEKNTAAVSFINCMRFSQDNPLSSIISKIDYRMRTRHGLSRADFMRAVDAFLHFSLCPSIDELPKYRDAVARNSLANSNLRDRGNSTDAKDIINEGLISSYRGPEDDMEVFTDDEMKEIQRLKDSQLLKNLLQDDEEVYADDDWELEGMTTPEDPFATDEKEGSMPDAHNDPEVQVEGEATHDAQEGPMPDPHNDPEVPVEGEATQDAVDHQLDAPPLQVVLTAPDLPTSVPPPPPPPPDWQLGSAQPLPQHASSVSPETAEQTQEGEKILAKAAVKQALFERVQQAVQSANAKSEQTDPNQPDHFTVRDTSTKTEICQYKASADEMVFTIKDPEKSSEIIQESFPDRKMTVAGGTPEQRIDMIEKLMQQNLQIDEKSYAGLSKDQVEQLKDFEQECSRGHGMSPR